MSKKTNLVLGFAVIALSVFVGVSTNTPTSSTVAAPLVPAVESATTTTPVSLPQSGTQPVSSTLSSTVQGTQKAPTTQITSKPAATPAVTPKVTTQPATTQITPQQTTTQTPAQTQPAPAPTATGPKTFTLAEVSAHGSASSCWTAINGGVYDVTSWINQHPGGQGPILSLCGHDGSSAFNGQHGGQARPASELASFKIGTLAQ